MFFDEACEAASLRAKAATVSSLMLDVHLHGAKPFHLSATCSEVVPVFIMPRLITGDAAFDCLLSTRGAGAVEMSVP